MQNIKCLIFKTVFIMEENNVNLREEMKKSIKTTSSLYMVFGVLQSLSALSY